MDNKKEYAKQEIRSLWVSIQKIYSTNFNLDKDRLKIKMDKNNMPQLIFYSKEKREKSEDFEVRFMDGSHTLSSKELNGAEVYRRFIESVGIEKVRALKIQTVHGENIISQNGIFVKTETPFKKDVIRRIINMLKVNAEIVDIQ